MKLIKKDGSPERRVVTGLVVSKEVLSRVAAKWEEGLFASPWANIVAEWCIDYHERYGKAPKKDITTLFESWSEEQSDKELVTAVERFLSSISDQYARLSKEINPDLIIDMAGDLFNKVKMTKHKEQVEQDLENGDVKKAMSRFDKFRPVEMGVGQWVDVLRDEDAIRKAFEDKKDPLITYSGGLGEFFGDALERDGFIAFMGPEKRGKSFGLIDIAWQGMKQGKKVAFFEVGDLSQSQIMRRFMVRASRRPLKVTPEGEPGLMVPTKLDMGPDGIEVEYDERRFDKPLAWGEAMKSCEKVIQSTKSNASLLRLSVHPNSSISVNGVRSYVDRWHKDDWSPDIILIDYADLLAPVNGTADTRDQINSTWKLLRRMSQDYHCLVVTATQSDAQSYDVETMTRSNFTEDKRKLAHVTGMIGINQTLPEKAKGIQRLNWIALREGEFSEDRCCYVVGCMAISSPYIKSYF